MPGKVNPSVPEMVNQVCFQVMGCDQTVAIACEAGQLELNVMMPVIAWNALHASTILREAMKVLRTRDASTASPPTRRARESCSIAAPRRPRRSVRTSATRRPPTSRRPLSKTGRTIRDLVLERGLLDAQKARRDALGGSHDDSGRIVGEEHRKLARDACSSCFCPLLPIRARLAACCCSGRSRRQQPRQRRCSRRRISGCSRAPIATTGSKPDQIMDALRIADGAGRRRSGAGGGWFTIRLARRVGPERRRLRARTSSTKMIEAIRRRVQREGLTNVRTVLGHADRFTLPRRLDAVLIVDAYHEMENPVAVSAGRRGASAQAAGPHRHRRLSAGAGGPGPDAGTARRCRIAVIKGATAAGLQVITRSRSRRSMFLVFWASRRRLHAPVQVSRDASTVVRSR